MKKAGKYIILIAAAVFLVCISQYYGDRVKAFNTSMSVRYRMGGMSGEQIDKLYEMEPESKEKKEKLPSITGWNKKTDKQLGNQKLGTEATVTLVEVWGDMSQVIPGKLLSGAYVSQVDKYGCVISKETAIKLFHSSGVIGNVLTLDGKDYQIRGVIQTKEEVVLLQSKGEEPFPFLEYRYSKGNYPASNTKAFLSSQGLSDYDSFLEGNLYGGAAGILMVLPFLTLLLCAAKRSCRYVKGKDILKKNYIPYTAIAVAGVGAAAMLLRYHISFSEDYIPSAVSDFEFWVEKFEAVAADIHSVMKYQTWWKEAEILNSLRNCAISAMGASLLIFIGFRLKRQ